MNGKVRHFGSGVDIQGGYGAYAPPARKVHNDFCDLYAKPA